MNERKQSSGDGKLPLPSPRSPGELDDKILTYARHQAPAKISSFRPRWAAGLATASVVAMALFIADPQLQAPGFRDAPATLEERTAPDKIPNGTAAHKPAAERMKMSRSAMAPAVVDKFELLSDEAQTEQEVASDAMLLPAPAGAGMSNNAPHPLTANTAGTQPKDIDTEDLVLQLRRCADLLLQGEEQQARAAYQQLRQGCPDCALPDTLEQAINAMLETDTP